MKSQQAVQSSSVMQAGRAVGKLSHKYFWLVKRLQPNLKYFCEIMPVVQKTSCYREKMLCSSHLDVFYCHIFRMKYSSFKKVFESTSFYHLQTSVHKGSRRVPQGTMSPPFQLKQLVFNISKTPFSAEFPAFSHLQSQTWR